MTIITTSALIRTYTSSQNNKVMTISAPSSKQYEKRTSIEVADGEAPHEEALDASSSMDRNDMLSSRPTGQESPPWWRCSDSSWEAAATPERALKNGQTGTSHPQASFGTPPKKNSATNSAENATEEAHNSPTSVAWHEVNKQRSPPKAEATQRLPDPPVEPKWTTFDDNVGVFDEVAAKRSLFDDLEPSDETDAESAAPSMPEMSKTPTNKSAAVVNAEPKSATPIKNRPPAKATTPVKASTPSNAVAPAKAVPKAKVATAAKSNTQAKVITLPAKATPSPAVIRAKFAPWDDVEPTISKKSSDDQKPSYKITIVAAKEAQPVIKDSPQPQIKPSLAGSAAGRKSADNIPTILASPPKQTIAPKAAKASSNGNPTTIPASSSSKKVNRKPMLLVPPKQALTRKKAATPPYMMPLTQATEFHGQEASIETSIGEKETGRGVQIQYSVEETNDKHTMENPDNLWVEVPLVGRVLLDDKPTLFRRNVDHKAINKADIYFRVARAAFSRSDFAVAAQSFLMCLQFLEVAYGKYHPSVADAYVWLGKSYWYDMQFSLAPDAFRRCYAILLQRPDMILENPDHSRKVVETWIVKALKVNGMHYGHAFLEMAKIAAENEALGDAMLEYKNGDEMALQHFCKAQELEQSWLLLTGIRPSLEMAELHFKIAFIHARRGRLDQAMACYSKALSHYRCLEEAVTNSHDDSNDDDGSADAKTPSTKKNTMTIYHQYIVDTCREIAKIYKAMNFSKTQVQDHLMTLMMYTPQECLGFALADQKKAKTEQAHPSLDQREVEPPQTQTQTQNATCHLFPSMDDEGGNFDIADDNTENRFQDILEGPGPGLERSLTFQQQQENGFACNMFD